MPKCATIKVKEKCLLVQVADSQAKYKPVTSKSKMPKCATVKVKQKCLLVQVADSTRLNIIQLQVNQKCHQSKVCTKNFTNFKMQICEFLISSYH